MKSPDKEIPAMGKNLETSRMRYIGALFSLFIFAIGVGSQFDLVGRQDWPLSMTISPSILKMAAVLSVLTGILLLWWAKRKLNSANFLTTFFLGVFAGGPFFMAYFMIIYSGLLIATNGFLDFSKPEDHVAKVQGTRTHTTLKKATYTYLYLSDWRNPHQQVWIEYPSGLSNLKKGTALTISTKRGLWGYEWLTGVHR